MRQAKTRLLCLCALGGVAWSGLAAAQGQARAVADAAPASIGTWRAVGDGRLDAVRGGFDGGDGLRVSFGIARQVFVNGNLVSSRSVQIPDVGRMTPAQAGALAAAVGANVIQVGPGNSVDPASLQQVAGATVIQNTLDNQHIQGLTTLDASVGNLNLFRGLNLQDSLQAGLVRSRGP
ncbi:hypothetical protein [Frateuria sp. Soil773]|uniref:hypothetical protein n=1 Tax=Frateuria sp. Soil773 TaxID=1736407 RepID=UPI0009E6D0EB|nr:hypothetical protein [Frateuria sp. Soil773]